MISKETILLTGGAGFIGANLIYKLIKTHRHIHLLSRKQTSYWRLKPILTQLVIHEIDMLNLPAVSKLMQRINPTVIVHLAAYGGYSYEEEIQKMIDVNIQMTIHLLQASKTIPYKIFINTGSSSEYGFKKKPMKETDVLEPNSFYAATKASSTFLCQVFAKEFQKPIVTLRPFSVYGPFEEKGRFISTLMMHFLQKKPMPLTSGKIRRDFIYSDDMTDAYISAIKQGSKIAGKVLNIGSGKEYSNDEVFRMMKRITGINLSSQKGGYNQRKWDTKHWIANISVIKKLLQWKPKYTLRKGLQETYTWYRQHQQYYI